MFKKIPFILVSFPRNLDLCDTGVVLYRKPSGSWSLIKVVCFIHSITGRTRVRIPPSMNELSDLQRQKLRLQLQRSSLRSILCLAALKYEYHTSLPQCKSLFMFS